MSKRGLASFLVAVACCLPISTLSVEAASSLVFPRLSSEPNTVTGLAISNLSAETATVTLTAYGTDGTVLSGSGITNPATLTIPAEQQAARLLTEIFHGAFPSSTIGWVRITSPTDGLTGFFLFLDGSLTEMDGADLPEAATQIVFNTVQAGNGFSTELNLVNTTGSDTVATLTLVQPGGADEIQKSVTLAARGVARLDAGSLFGLASIPDASYVHVDTDGGLVAGLEFIRSAGGDLLGLNARKASEKLESLFFPQLVVSGPWKTELGLVNYTDDPVLVTVYARKPDGSLYGASELASNPVSRGLGPREALLLDVADLFGFTGQNSRDGWLEVEASEQAINGFLSYGIPAVGSLAAIAANQSQTSSVFSHIATTSGFYTGLALLNPSSLSANVRILAFTPEGDLLGRSDTVVRPKQRVSKLVTELIAGTENRSNGFIWIKSSVPLYTSALFGAEKVLANIPPQQPPPTYVPDQDLSKVALTPLLAVVQPGKSQKFTASGASGPVTWAVNGIDSGDSSVGTIDSTGLYTAPASKPEPSLITVSAESDNLSGGASVDILTTQSLVGGLGVLQSIVYMQSLQRLYEVELTSLGAVGSRISATSQTAAATDQSELFQVQPPNVKTSVRQFTDNIVKLISYPASDGKEYMLLLGQSTGQLIRLEPLSGQSRLVYTGLQQPTSMAYDASTGSVLVAESDRITQIARTFIESGLTSGSGATGEIDPGQTPRSTVALAAGATGLAVDRCTGEIYFSIASEGVIRAYDPATEQTRTLVSGLSSPGQLLTLYREGLPCPERTQLLVAEPGADRITLIAPSLGSVVSWISAPGVRDLSFIPPENPFNLKTSVAYGLFFDEAGNISIVDVGDQYSQEPPVVEEPICQSEVSFEDSNLEAAVRAALGLNAGDAITCAAAQSLTELSASGRNIRRIGGLEFFTNLEVLDLSHNFIRSIAPVGALTHLSELNASYNLITSPGLSANLTQLSQLDLSYNLIDDLSTLVNLDVGSPGSPARIRARRVQALPSLTQLNLSYNSISDVSPLSPLTSLTSLDLSGNFSIEDLSGLSPLLGLQQLFLQWNVIRSLSALTPLEALQLLDLRHNSVVHLSPLLDNPGIGEGDRIYIANNPIDLSDCAVFQTLKDRGVVFDYDPPCDVDLEVALSSPSEVVRYGDLLLLRARVTNLGTANALSPTLRVQLDPNLILRSAIGGGAVCSTGGSTVNCRWSQLAPATPATVEVRAFVQKRTGSVTSTAHVAAAQSELDTGNNDASLSIPLASADLEVTKTATPDPVSPNAALTYTIIVANHGPSTATAVEISDELPSGFSVETQSISSGSCNFDANAGLLQCAINSLAAGNEATITVEGVVTQGPGELRNVATATAQETDPSPGNNTGVAITPVVQPDLVVTKTASVDPAITGTPLVYSVSIVNNGNGPATNLVISDSIPEDLGFVGYTLPGGSCISIEGQLTCQLASLPGGESTVLTIDTTVNTAVTSVTNTVTVTEDQDDLNPDDNTSTVTTAVIQRADVSVTKSAAPTLLRNGDTVTYTVDVFNQGPSPATAVFVQDTLPSDLFFSGASAQCSENQASGQIECNLGTLSPGNGTSVQIQAYYNGEANGTVFTNQVAVSASEPDPDLANNTFSMDVALAQADLSVTLSDNPDPVISGNNITLTAQVTNLGPDDATFTSTYLSPVFGLPTVTMVSALSSQGTCNVNAAANSVSCDLGTLAAGATATVTVTATSPALTSPDTVQNTFSAYSNEADPNGANNTATEATTVNP